MSLEKIYVADSRIAGRGIYAKEDMRPGEPILNLRGSIITFEETLRKPVDGYPLQVGRDSYLDLLEPEAFLNHSCRPNTGIRELTLIALTEIPSGRELYFDYSTSMDEEYWTMPCTCGAEDCRGIVRDFKYLPPALQKEYLRLEVVQEFIVRQHTELMRAVV